MEELMSFNEMLKEIEELQYEANQALHNGIENRLPQIILIKLNRKVWLWESVYTAILEYKNWTEPTEDDCVLCTENETKDMVNSPKHYTDGQFEVIDVIKDWLTEEEFRGYIKGNTIKYVSRERLKNGDEDLFKTLFYLNYLMNGVKSDGRKK